MWLLILVLTVLSLIFVYKNNFFTAKITAVITTILYFVLSWHKILNMIIMIQSGIIGTFALMLDMINLALLILLCVLVFKKAKKTSLYLLWIMIIILILSKWNTWLSLTLYLKNLMNK
ncbi:MAG: hypothetical protein IJC74_04175 [Clostridia bacterium]|nr:hypothetical protein [Clostridia bacterium]